MKVGASFSVPYRPGGLIDAANKRYAPKRFDSRMGQKWGFFVVRLA